MFKALLILIIAAYVIFVCVKKIRDFRKGKYCSCCDCGCGGKKCGKNGGNSGKKTDN